MKYVLGLILSLISADVLADAIPLPPCTINNQPVRYVSISADYANAYTGFYIAGSDIVNGQPTIGYNSELLSKESEKWSRQVMLHECAHLKIHAMPMRNPPDKEYEADCHSAMVLRKEYGYKEEDFDIVIQTMQKYLPPDRIHAFQACLNR